MSLLSCQDVVVDEVCAVYERGFGERLLENEQATGLGSGEFSPSAVPPAALPPPPPLPAALGATAPTVYTTTNPDV